MFENYRTFETTYAGRPLVVETGKTCGLSNGSCWVRYGETVVMANVTAVSYTHLRAHETPEHLVCRLLLEKKKIKK